jgi:hypothetical protein
LQICSIRLRNLFLTKWKGESLAPCVEVSNCDLHLEKMNVIPLHSMVVNFIVSLTLFLFGNLTFKKPLVEEFEKQVKFMEMEFKAI